MARGAPTERPIKFKKRFKPRKVEIDGKDDATYVFETAALYRSTEEEIDAVLQDAVAEANDADSEKDNLVVNAYLALIDKLIKPIEGKKTLASKVLRELWEAEQIESADITGFFDDLVSNRRPT